MFSGQGDRAVARPTHVSGTGSRRPFPRRYTSRHRASRRARTPCPGRPRASSVRAPTILWRPPVRTPGRHLQRPPLQPAHSTRINGAAEPPPPGRGPGRHWRAPSADAVRAPRLCPGRFRDLDDLCTTNLVDEVTQFQFIGSVEHLHAACLAPVSALLRAFPFTLHGFHSDNAEYVNRTVAALLEALHIDEFTKSRARHTNDNALVESKKLGRPQAPRLRHIPSRHAPRQRRTCEPGRRQGPPPQALPRHHDAL